MTRQEASKQIADILEYFEDRIEMETDPAFDKEIAKKDADALRMAINVLGFPKDSSIGSSTDKVYVVTQDGYGYLDGSEIYLVGVFTDKKEAEKEFEYTTADITEIQLDKAFPLVKSNWGGVGNDYYLGGYIE